LEVTENEVFGTKLTNLDSLTIIPQQILLSICQR
jgi:hypothetical protein